MAVPFFDHWYDNGAVPLATTVKVAVEPGITVWLAGWVVMEGSTAPVTVKVATELVTFP